MAGKITDAATQTGANVAAGDLFETVDVSNTSMAATGTNETITADELAIALGTTLGVVGRDKIWGAAGDVLIGTADNAGTNLAIGTAAGKALVADPNAANKASIQFPHGVEEATTRGSASTVLAATCDRRPAVEVNVAALSTGRLTVTRIALPKGLPVTSILFTSATTAASVPLNQWFALFDSSKNLLAITGDDTTTAWAANSNKTLSITSGPFVTTYAGHYWVGVMVLATTVPTLGGAGSGTAHFRGGGATAAISQAANSALTNPASCPNPYTYASAIGSLIYAEIL